MMDLYNKKFHFIGIGGVSMSSLALITTRYSHYISGSDKVYSDTLSDLSSKGISTYVGSSLDSVHDADIVVYSLAIRDDDIELVEAMQSGKIVYSRGEYLSVLESMSSSSIAVAGTHGKSTVTALISHIFKMSGGKNTYHIGAHLIDEDIVSDGEDIFITEACEYKKSFLYLHPTLGVVLDIDYDHPDSYRDIEETRSAFDEFMDNSSIVLSHESVGRGVTYGYGDSDYHIDNVTSSHGKYSFDIVTKEKIFHIDSPLLGRYNILNVTASVAVCDMMGISEDVIVKGISTFKGLHRRCEIVGKSAKGATIISDYAHHPREISSAIEIADSLTSNKVIVVFEPHTYSRTRSLIEGFLTCFYFADTLILLPTYSAREVETDGYSTLNLLTCLHSVGEYPLYFDSYKRAKEYLDNFADNGDIILVLGAGTIDHLAHMLIAK